MAEYFEKSCHALHVNGRIFFNTSDEPYRHTLCVRFYFCFVTDSTDNNDRTFLDREERVEFLHRTA